MNRLILLLTIYTCTAVSACAEDMKWDDLCDAAKTRELTIVTNAGNKVRGQCYNQTGDRILLNAAHGTISRGDIKSIRLDKHRRWHSASHVLGAAAELGFGGIVVFATPVFYFGPPLLVGALGTLAGAPFCALFDWLATPGSTKITII